MLPDVEDVTNNNNSDVIEQPMHDILTCSDEILKYGNQLLRGKFKVGL